MYISRSLITFQGEPESDLFAKVEAAHESRRGAEGFRWAMLLRSIDDATDYASVSMWLTPEHDQTWREANETPAPAHGYDVTTARGSMTPASAVAIVDWPVRPAEVDRFAARWNAVYHAIENVIGSRLLRNLASPDSFAALHVVTDPERLDPAILSADLTDTEGLSIAPAFVQRFEVVLLTEAP